MITNAQECESAAQALKLHDKSVSHQRGKGIPNGCSILSPNKYYHLLFKSPVGNRNTPCESTLSGYHWADFICICSEGNTFFILNEKI